MLGRITNISTNPDFKQSRKSQDFGKYFSGSHTHNTGIHDSVTLSPALLFLNEIKWHLKDINQTQSEKMLLVFQAASFEFSTTVDLININYLDKLEYDVLKERELNDGFTKALARFSVKINPNSFEELENIILFRGFNNLFDRLFLLDMDCELDASESKVIDNLLDGIDGEIRYEFNYINSGVLTFIEKLKGINIPRFKPLADENGNLVTLLKIKTSNAEILKPERTAAKRIL
ncbi:MAG: hypothetical protein K8H86_01200 [Ignavibacteriaceae bacterium]|nr:hypothetical protein [Ignavibacteriaceae bacterium]